MSLGNSSVHQRGEIPEITKLPNGRIRVIRRFEKFTREDVDNASLGSLLGDFGDLDTTGEQIAGQGYTDCRLISVEVDTRVNSTTNTENPLLVQTYETLTSAFVEITDPTVEINENGLRKITKVFRAVSGTTSDHVVGTTALATGEILASSEIEDTTAFAQLTEVYLEAGIISETTRPAPAAFAGAIEVTRVSAGVVSLPTGVLIDSVDQDVEGYKTFTRTCLQASGTDVSDLTGVTQVYKDLVQVDEIGTVELTTIATETGGTMAIVKATPPRVKQVSVDVTTEIVTSPTATAPTSIAYNLEDASVSVTTTKSSLQIGSGATVIAKDGGTSLSATGFNKNISNSARIQIYEGSYLSSGTNPTIGTESYISSERPRLNATGNAISTDTSTSTEKTTCTATGATALPSSYKTYGLIKRESRHIITALNGTKYYEETSFTIPQP